MKQTVRGPLAALIGCFFILILDQWSKYVFFSIDRLRIRPTFSFLAGWIQSVQHENFGIAFNIPLPTWLILLITFMACMGLLIALRRERHRSHVLPSLFLGLLLGGAIGNAIDRLLLGFVRDWLLLWHRSAINIADLGVIIGLLGIIWLQSREQQTLDKVQDPWNGVVHALSRKNRLDPRTRGDNDRS